MRQELKGTIVLKDRLIPFGRVTWENGRITAVEELESAGDGNCQYILPGLIDIHNHGAVCHDYMEATDEAFDCILDYLTSHGITSTQCTTVSAPLEQIGQFLDFYRKRAAGQDSSVSRCRLVGVHIEGPYIAPASSGAHQPSTLRAPLDGYEWLTENADIIGEITVAPELPGMPEMIKKLTECGIVVSGGHDSAEVEDIELAVDNGMSHCTHIYCAMSTLHKKNGHRRCGLVEYAMTHDTLTAEIIADNHHVPPMLAQMVYKAKGAEKLCIVSDSIAPGGMPDSDRVYKLGTGKECTRVIVDGGVAMVEDRTCYAGSVQSIDLMVQNLVRDAGIPMVDAVRMASLTPAEVVGIDGECGSIEVGKRADLCVMDARMKVVKTVIEGKTVYEA